MTTTATTVSQVDDYADIQPFFGVLMVVIMIGLVAMLCALATRKDEA